MCECACGCTVVTTRMCVRSRQARFTHKHGATLLLSPRETPVRVYAPVLASFAISAFVVAAVDRFAPTKCDSVQSGFGQMYGRTLASKP